MSLVQPFDPLRLPASLEGQLVGLRRRLWTIKSIEAAGAALVGVCAAYLTLFALDRVLDTPLWARVAIFVFAVAACGLVPICLHRWIWCHRRLDQLARLVSRRHASLGDQMLGVIELVRNEFEQNRSRALCIAAIQQVADLAARRDLGEAVPRPRHRHWTAATVTALAIAVSLAAAFPEAAANAWSRLLRPWQPIPRYTFTQLDGLPPRLVVPHGEPFTVAVELLDESPWRPAVGIVQLDRQAAVTADLGKGRYVFSLPGQIDRDGLSLQIGDARQRTEVEPMTRPELTKVEAQVQLPVYLERAQPLQRDARGGTLTLVRGSRVSFVASANRRLASASIDGVSAAPRGSDIVSPPLNVDESRKMEFRWTDEFGLGGQEPFSVSIVARDDEAPSLSCEDLPRQRVVLNSETLTFAVHAQDDFGIRSIGMEWQGIDSAAVAQPAQGERLLAAGASDRQKLECGGTFCAQTLKIEPQPLTLRLFVEDYFPGRARVYSPTYTLYVLSAEQHFVWLTEQLSKWHRQALEVRDREMQLHHANQQLRLLLPEELDQPETRRRIETQAAAERANGRRLGGLLPGGEDLIRQAMRNPEFGVGHIEKWAEMLQILKDISTNRMPNVADLLKQSSQTQAVAAEATKSPPTAGQIRSAAADPANKTPQEAKPPAIVPQLVDAESSQQPPDKNAPPPEPSQSNSKPSLRLPVTTVMGQGSKKPQPPAAQKLDDAVTAQQDLLAEFEKIADELNKVLANLEGSTLLKRLKAASREQYLMAGKLGDHLSETFGQRANAPPAAARQPLAELSGIEKKSSQTVSAIMDDMQSYFERRRFQRFKTVLDEMRAEDAVGSLRQLSDDVQRETGMSVAQCEFWSDTFDRWADNLVDPAACGKCPGCKSKSSLPPSVVLEAMQILEAEVNLREETRGTQQARGGLAEPEFAARCGELRTAQDALSERVGKLTTRIRELPDGEAEFAKEIALLQRVEQVMGEAAEILGRPESGPTAIAAETEAIELLLQSKRINPRGGGGGGASPGGGGGGSTTDAALALIGSGSNDKEVREDRGITQATGEAGSALPEEFRAGLDEYFNRLERAGGQP